LRHKIKTLKEDDQRILWEGIDSLTKMELREACQERGMRSTGLSKEAYRRSLQQWLDLSVNMNVPISLLIMSRTFFLQEESVTPASGDEAKSVAGLADAISGLDKEVLNEVILEVATSEEKKSDPDVRKIKLEVLSHQNEKIREEQAERESAAKKKETAESLEAEKSEAQSQESASEPPKAQDIPREQKKEAESEDAPEYSVTEKFFDDRNDMVEINTKEQEEQIESPVEEEKCDSDLSADEIEALEELVSADPVKKEKEDLERIKSAMKKSSDGEEIEEDEEQEKNAIEDTIGSVVDKSEAVFQSAEIYVTSVVEESEKKAFSEAEKLTVFSTESSGRENNTKGQEQEPSSIVDEEGINKLEETDKEQEEDVVVAALKNRIEKMVDKIEVQLSDAQMKIGDKLHFLDKDMDGILSREEIVESLQQVLKREITIEEAEEIFSEMV
jgi:LETM1 and EF-hand domain-containing protein 1